MNVRLVHEFRFEAAHQLLKVPAQHKCARLHGHSFKVEVALIGPVDPATGWFVDFGVLHEAWRPLYEQLDHRFLNEVDGLSNPTSENLARWLWVRLEPQVPGLSRITVHETCETRCEYEGG